MADEDVLISARLDIDPVETALDKLDKAFDRLSQKNLNFTGLNDSIKGFVSTLGSATEAMKAFDAAARDTFGRSFSGSFAKDNANVAKNIQAQAVATERLAKARRSLQNATNINARAEREPSPTNDPRIVHANRQQALDSAFKKQARDTQASAADARRRNDALTRGLGVNTGSVGGERSEEYMRRQNELQTAFDKQAKQQRAQQEAMAQAAERYNAQLTNQLGIQPESPLGGDRSEAYSRRQTELQSVFEKQANDAERQSQEQRKQQEAMAQATARYNEALTRQLGVQPQSPLGGDRSEAYSRRQSELQSVFDRQAQEQARQAQEEARQAQDGSNQSKAQRARAAAMAEARDRYNAQITSQLGVHPESPLGGDRSEAYSRRQTELQAVFDRQAQEQARQRQNEILRNMRQGSFKAPGQDEFSEDDHRQLGSRIAREYNQYHGGSNFRKSTGMGASEMAEMEKYVNATGTQLREFPGFFDRMTAKLGTHLGMWVQWEILIASTTAAAELLEQTLKRSSEFQVQGVQFDAGTRSAKAQGLSTDGSTQSDMYQAAIQLARKYGEEVSNTAQDIDLWRKSTGSLDAAILMTDETMKFHMVTGTKLEDMYKTLTALSVQAGDMPLTGQDKKGFTLAQTPQLMKMLYAASQAAGGGMLQIGENGQASGGNAAINLLDSLDKDAAGLKALGFNMQQAITLNAALTKAFGNTASAGSEAGEKLSRIMGGLASFSDPAEGKKLAKLGIDPNMLREALMTNGHELDVLAEKFKELKKQPQLNLSRQIGGQRQWEALNAVLELSHGELQKVQKAMHDLTQEDKAAAEMQGTFQVAEEKLAASFEGLEVAVGMGVLPLLTELVNYVASTLVPALANAAQSIGSFFNSIGSGIKESMDISLAGAALTSGDLKGAKGYWDLSRQESANSTAAQDRWSNLGETNYQAPDGHFNSKTGQFDTIMDGKGSKRHPRMRTYPNKQVFLDEATGKTSPWTALQDPRDIAKDIRDNAFRNKQAMNALAHANSGGGKPEEPASILGTDSGASTNKELKDYEKFAQILADIRAKFQDINAAAKDLHAAGKTALESASRRISREGLGPETLSQYDTAASRVQSDDNKELRQLQGQEGTYKSEMREATRMRGKYPQGTSEYRGWDEQYRSAHSDFLSTRGEERTIKAEIAALGDDKLGKKETFNEAGHTKQQTKDNSAVELANKLISRESFSDKEKGLSELANAYKTQKSDELAYIGTLKGQKHNDAWDALQESTAKNSRDLVDKQEQVAKELESFTRNLNKGDNSAVASIASANVSVGEDSGRINKFQAEMLQEEIKLQEKRNDLQLQYTDLLKQAGSDKSLVSQVNQWDALQSAALDAEAAAEAYKVKLEEIQSSPWYTGLKAALDDAAKSFSTYIENSLLGTNGLSDKLQQLKGQMEQLQGQNSFDNMLYSGGRYHSGLDAGNEAIINAQNAQAQKALEQQTQAAQYKQSNPSFFQTIGKTMLGSLLDGTLTGNGGTGSQGGIVGTILSAVTNKATGTNQQQQQNTQALAKLTSEMQGPFSHDIQTFQNSSQNIVTAANTMLQAANTIATSQGGAAGALGGGGAGSLLTTLAGMNAAAASGTNVIGNGLDYSGKDGSTGTGGTSGVAGFLSKNMGFIAAAGAVASAFATSATAGAGSLVGGGLGAVLGGPAGAQIGASIGSAIGSLLGPHYNQTKNPDMYADDGYAQGVANLQGSAYTQANGAVAIDPTLKTALGGQNELQYMDAFYKAHPGGQGLTGASLDLWKQVGQETGNGTAAGISNLKQGNVDLTNASGQTIDSGNWQTLMTNLGNTAQSLYQFQSALNNATQESLYVVNAYGASSGFFPYAWNTPAYDTPTNPPANGNPQNPVNPYGLSSTNPVSTNNVNNLRASTGVTSAVQNTPVALTVTTNLDGREIARSTQSYQVRAASAGYQNIT